MNARHCWCFHGPVSHLNGVCINCRDTRRFGRLLQHRHLFRTIDSLRPIYVPPDRLIDIENQRSVSL